MTSYYTNMNLKICGTGDDDSWLLPSLVTTLEMLRTTHCLCQRPNNFDGLESASRQETFGLLYSAV